MKNHFSFLLLLSFLISCHTEKEMLEPHHSMSAFFGVNHPSNHQSSTLDIKFEGEVAHVIRGDEPRNHAYLPDQLFFETEVTWCDNGIISIPEESIGKKKIWFVSFYPGTGAIALDGKQCLQFLCVNKKDHEGKLCPWEADHRGVRCMDPFINPDRWPYLLSVRQIQCDDPYCIKDYTNGGVIFEADSVVITDPPWYDPSKHGPSLFCWDDKLGGYVKVERKK